MKLLNLLKRTCVSGCSWKRCRLESKSNHPRPLPEIKPPVECNTETFVLEAHFVRELMAALTTDANEHMRFLTGPKFGRVRVVCRWAQPGKLDRQSPVFVRASAQSVAAALIPIVEQGAELHMVAHSHPFSGPDGTRPSSTDIACLGKIQKGGSPVIGCIVSRDGWVRFFSVTSNFRVLLLGTGTAKLSAQVFYVGHHHHD